MESPSISESISGTSPEGTCEKCGAPSTWAEEWTQNLSWKDGSKFHMATYFASPRMWPLGYLLGSPYSPLNLEQEHPDFNWRDPFEDLIALESGKDMISAASRQKEAVTISRIYRERVHEDISRINQELQRNQDYIVLMQKLREISVRRKNTDVVAFIDEKALPERKESASAVIAKGKALISRANNLTDKPASSFKKRIPWIISLISSGAMLGWKSVLYDSANGLHADVYRDDGSGDGHMFSELDVAMIFKKGHRLEFISPSWSTYDGLYNDYSPEIEQLCPDRDDPDAEYTYQTIGNIPPSIHSQITSVQQEKSWNGSIGMRVTLRNCFTDGHDEEKMIVNDASKVLEEAEKAHYSMNQRRHAVGLALWELAYRKQKEVVASAQEREDAGVE